jgi:shikimate dehydrogenase
MMHEAALKEAGLHGHYLPLKLLESGLKAALEGLLVLGFQGLNVTAPHKEAVIPFLFSLSPEARIIGAVNTLINTPQGFEGHNTDAPGFAMAYLKNNQPGQKFLLFGAGGAARAIIAAFKSLNLDILITNRDLNKAEKLAHEFQQKAIDLKDIGSHGPYDTFVNATSASYAEDLDPPIQVPMAKRGMVIDINYGRPYNYWNTLASEQGAKFYDGLPMLAEQARLSFNLWTNARVSLKPFAQALEIYLESGLN